MRPPPRPPPQPSRTTGPAQPPEPRAAIPASALGGDPTRTRRTPIGAGPRQPTAPRRSLSSEHLPPPPAPLLGALLLQLLARLDQLPLKSAGNPPLQPLLGVRPSASGSQAGSRQAGLGGLLTRCF